MATDIAFAIGVLALLSNRVPSSLKIFLLSLAIVDDIGAILVIALFYSGGIAFGWLLAATGLLAAIVVLRRPKVYWTPVYVLIGSGVWLATFQSGVHATIVGAALGLLTPAARPTVKVSQMCSRRQVRSRQNRTQSHSGRCSFSRARWCQLPSASNISFIRGRASW